VTEQIVCRIQCCLCVVDSGNSWSGTVLLRAVIVLIRKTVETVRVLINIVIVCNCICSAV
jgi:hypothetical protein